MNTINLFVAKELPKNKIKEFETLLSAYGKAEKITGCGECGDTKCYSLEVLSNDSVIIKDLLEEISCTVSYHPKINTGINHE